MRPLFVFLLMPAIAAHAQINPLSYGTMKTWDRGSSFFIAAPHGGFDDGTDTIVENFLNTNSWNGITAVGYRKWEHPINVNRPTEGIGEASSLEKHTDEARIVYDAFRRELAALSGYPPRLYVEIHGNSRPQSAENIEIASIGIPLDPMRTLKALFTQELRDAGIVDLGVAVEGIDKIHYKAGASKRDGTLHDLVPALHFEIPENARINQISQLGLFFNAALPNAAEVVATGA